MSLMEVSALIAEQLDKQRDHTKEQVKELRDHDGKVQQEMDRLREEAAKAQGRAEMQSKVDELREAAVEARLRENRTRDQQLVALQARLEALSAAKLLTDEELYAVEDIIADAAEAAEDASRDDRAEMLLGLSGRIVSDTAFARQLRRKVAS